MNITTTNSILRRGNQELCEVYNEDRSRVVEVMEAMPSDDSVEEAVRVLKAVADPVRARILYALSEKELCVCELSYLLGMSLPAVSHHLRLLRDARLIRPRKVGKFVFYQPTELNASELVRHLICAESSPVQACPSESR
ncbi:MAG: winged helix-turn-helix transcriptional regulator [Armatimonadetes bacterium]|nr:winged helix-turn-helix transcriptional regulator [Armatimonadota bacterium]